MLRHATDQSHTTENCSNAASFASHCCACSSFAHEMSAPLDIDAVLEGRAGPLGIFAPPGPIKHPKWVRMEEKAEHRMMAVLKASGRSITDIALLLDYTPVQVGRVLRQPDVRKMVFEEIARRGSAGLDALHALFESQAVESVETVVTLRDDAKVPAAVRLAASNTILDRVLGKAVQRVETMKVTEKSPQALSDEIEAIEAKLAKVTGSAKTVSSVPKFDFSMPIESLHKESLMQSGAGNPPVGDRLAEAEAAALNIDNGKICTSID